MAKQCGLGVIDKFQREISQKRIVVYRAKLKSKEKNDGLCYHPCSNC